MNIVITPENAEILCLKQLAVVYDSSVNKLKNPESVNIIMRRPWIRDLNQVLSQMPLSLPILRVPQYLRVRNN